MIQLKGSVIPQAVGKVQVKKVLHRVHQWTDIVWTTNIVSYIAS